MKEVILEHWSNLSECIRLWNTIPGKSPQLSLELFRKTTTVAHISRAIEASGFRTETKFPELSGYRISSMGASLGFSVTEISKSQYAELPRPTPQPKEWLGFQSRRPIFCEARLEKHSQIAGSRIERKSISLSHGNRKDWIRARWAQNSNCWRNSVWKWHLYLGFESS